MRTAFSPSRLLLCACVLWCCSCGSAGGRNAESGEVIAKRYAEELAKLAGPGAEGDEQVTLAAAEDDLQMVSRRVADDLLAGRQEPIAELVLHRDALKRNLWYPHAESAFARSWRDRRIPLGCGASRSTMKALTRLAREGESHNACVAAAEALMIDDPVLAKSTLMREYGRFQVDEFTGYFWWCTAAGPSLRSMGVRVPNELTTIHKAYLLIEEHRPSPVGEIKKDRMSAAVNVYNAKLHELLQQGDMRSLGVLLDSSRSRFDLLMQSLEIAKEQPPLRGPGVFGETKPEDTDDDVGIIRK